MKYRPLILLISLFTAINTLSAQSPASGTLKIKFTGVQNDIGYIAIGMNRNPEGWPREPHLSFHWEKEKIEKGVFTAEIKDLPFGTYAISVLDDENKNFEMDMIIGIPQEGYGFSNNPPTKLKAPRFHECSFQFNRSEQVVTIEMKYIGKGKK